MSEGAFDRVCSQRLVAKLAAQGVPQSTIELFQSWLRQRDACVVVDGDQSDARAIFDMVFQGPVWGPMFWNAFFEDARSAVAFVGFLECVFADDLNAWRTYDRSAPDALLLDAGRRCQVEVHRWGDANQVTFEPSKELVPMLSTTAASQWSFRLLGVPFDACLSMADGLAEVVHSASSRLCCLLRCRRFYGVADLVLQYKAKVLSYIEYRTPAI